MTGLILMLAVAAAMALLRESLGRGLFVLVRGVDKKRLAMLAVVLFLVWALLHQIHLILGPIPGDALVALFDSSTYAALFDVSAYADLAVGLAAMVLSERTRRMIGHLIDLVRPIVDRLMRRAGRARRSPARLRRRLPDRDEPEPEAFGGVLAFA